MTPPPTRLLAIIPARAGSKGVVRKNMRLLGGRPLIAHTVDALTRTDVVDRLLISTNDPEVSAWARIHGIEVDPRPDGLAGNSTTISEVAAYIADKLDWDEDIGVFQPTSPFRSIESIEKAVSLFRSSNVDSLSTAMREPHLYWFDEQEDISSARPLFKERINRQFAHHGVLRETGSIQLVRGNILRQLREIVTERHILFEVDAEAGIDIDTPEDLADARRRLDRHTIIFRIKANARVGSGHLYHCLQLAEELEDHEVRFLLKECDPFVQDALIERGLPSQVETDLRKDLEAMVGTRTTLVVNDVLDTSQEEVLVQKSLGYLVVNIEDLGRGARYADWVVNALYPVREHVTGSVAWGPKYATLRPEFLGLPSKQIHEKAHQILITFGGTDPTHLAKRCAALLQKSLEATIRVVLGRGAQDAMFPPGVVVVRNVKSMAAEMMDADLILTSGGRTVYEAAATGTPVVVLAQNAREATHAHLSFDVGTIFLGVGSLVTDEQIVSVCQRLLSDWELRSELSQRLRNSIDDQGVQRISSEIRNLLRGL